MIPSIIWWMTNPSALVTAMDDAGRRLTGPRRVVADLIDAREGHFTAADLVADARERRLEIGRATVFRALELLTELGVVERLDLPTGEHAYVACAPRHHHHVVCTRCGRSRDVDDAGLRSVVERVADTTGYSDVSHRLELFGICPDCARRARTA